MPKSTKETLGLLKAVGVDEVLLRYIEPASGNLKEQMVPIDDIPEECFQSGITIKDSQIPDATVFPDKQSAWMNPFQEKPSLAFFCYLSKKDILQPPTESPAGNPFFSPIPGSSSSAFFPKVLLQSPAPSGFADFSLGSSKFAVPPTAPPTASGGFMYPLSMTPVTHPGHVDMSMPPFDMAGLPVAPQSESDYEMMKKKKNSKGTSCHQCKNARPLDQLAYCNNMFDKRTTGDKRVRLEPRGDT
jgi:hypothetical protein